MNHLIRLTQKELHDFTAFRRGEIKFGERVITIPRDVSVEDFLGKSQARFVLFGIPEDIGVKANFGRVGARTAYQNALKALVNIQHNKFTKGYDLLILGHLDTQSYQEQADLLDPNDKDDLKKLHDLVKQLDKEVTHLVSLIVGHNKIPIVIGGGHNNSYGIIKGTALGKGKPINSINFDAHTDFRALEGRHSGNGFSYAYDEGFLDKYFIFGIHENYTSKAILQLIKKTANRVQFNTFEQISVRSELRFEDELNRAISIIGNQNFGIEIDLDAVENIPSSAMTLSGFSTKRLRQFLHFFANHRNVAYLHICEGAPILSDEKNPNLVGKLIAYLITDFIKAQDISNETSI